MSTPSARGLQMTGLRGDRRSGPSRAVDDPREVIEADRLSHLVTKTRDTDGALSAADGSASARRWRCRCRTRSPRTIGSPAGSARARCSARPPPKRARSPAPGRCDTSPPRRPRSTSASSTVGSRTPRSRIRAGRACSPPCSPRPAWARRRRPTFRQAEWEKLLQISVVAGFSASTLGFRPGLAFAHGIAVRSGAEHYVTIARELLAVYRAMGFEPRDFFAPFSRFPRARRRQLRRGRRQPSCARPTMVANGIIGRPSLHEDIVQGRPTEVEDGLGPISRPPTASVAVPPPAARIVSSNAGGLQ